MNILYMIGNGFDLAQNLKTSYQDFYNYLVEQKPKNVIQAKMLEQITGEEHEKWSDLEVALGEFTKDIDDKASFEDFYFDLCDQLRTYLIGQTNGFEATEQLIDKYIKDLVHPDFYLTPREQLAYERFLSNYPETRKINIVSFNYTDIIDKCLDVYNADRNLPTNGYSYKLIPTIKLHGTLGTSYLLMGVNDEKQIANSSFAKDEDVLDYIVKPRSNYGIGTRVEEIVTRSIENAQIIVTMGLSFGETDKIWWQTIGKRIQSNNRVYILIFAHENNLPADDRRKLPIKRRIRREFLSKCGIKPEQQSRYEEQIFVSINSGMFSPNNIIYQDDRKGL